MITLSALEEDAVASGTLSNLATSGFVRTPPAIATTLVQSLLDLPAAPFRALDPTCGEGDLLAPLMTVPQARLVGIEISHDRVAVARSRLPGADLYAHPIEAVRLPVGGVDLLLANPPYLFVDGKRAEYRILTQVGAALRPSGVLVAILPARSAWDARMQRHWATHYSAVRCWRFPDARDDQDEVDFARFTQMVVVGIRRSVILDAPDPDDLRRLAGWQYGARQGSGSPWRGGTPPPVLPDRRLPDPYPVPAHLPGVWTVSIRQPDEADRLRALAESPMWSHPQWQAATTSRTTKRAAPAIMPSTGEAHLAADILTGLLDGHTVPGPDGALYVLATFVTTHEVPVPVDPDELERQQARGVRAVTIHERRDLMVLGAVSLATGVCQWHVGDEATTALIPWLDRLAARVLEARRPVYRLDPDDWEIAAVAPIGHDKQLPGSPHPGLVAPQQHRVYALGHALDTQRVAGLQGEPGVGKTRMLTALMARQAALWQGQGDIRPAWVRDLARAWARHPVLGPRMRDRRPALPVLVATPKRVTKTWRDEIASAYPEAEVLRVPSYRAIPEWLARCAETAAPVVVGIVSHSTSRAFGRIWVPVVLAIPEPETDPLHAGSLRPVYRADRLVGYRDPATGRLVPKRALVTADLPPAQRAAYDEVRDDGNARVGYRDRQTGEWLSEPVYHFACPDCFTVIWDTPRRDAASEVVRDATWFRRQPRTCWACGTPLWSEARLNERPRLTYAQWDQATRMTPRAAAWPLDAATAMRTLTGGWTAPPPDSFSPYDYLDHHFRGCVALAIIDESHNARGRRTDRAHALHQAQLASQTCVYASGTHYGGTLDDFFAYWYRLHPAFWQQFGLGWQDTDEAVEQFGVIQRVITERESEARRGSGTTDITEATVVAPGISARLIPHLLADLVFLTVLDVGAYMPPRREIPVLVSLADPDLTALRTQATATLTANRSARATRDPDLSEADWQACCTRWDEEDGAAETQLAWVQARDLARAYDRIVDDLEQVARDRHRAAGTAQLALGTIPRWFVTLPCAEPFTVTYTERSSWGKALETETLLTTPRLADDYRYPLERRLQAIVESERAEGRRVMIYVDQTTKRSMAERLTWVLEGHHPWTLATGTEADEREDAIRAAVAAGHGVVLVPYRLVSEGLNLQDCIDTIIWAEMAQNLFLLDQASRRAWRLGKREEVRIYYLAYAGTAAHRKLRKLGGQSGAASAFAGEPTHSALVEAAGADTSVLNLVSRALAERSEAEEAAELTTAFARRDEELRQTLRRGRRWLGITDTLPERLARWHAPGATVSHLDDLRPDDRASAFVPPELGSAIPEDTGVGVLDTAGLSWNDLRLRYAQPTRKRRVRPTPDLPTLWGWETEERMSGEDRETTALSPVFKKGKKTGGASG